MINYVNNAYDKVLKPCDAQQFQILTQSAQTERLIALHRSGDARAKQNLSALTYMGVLDKEKYKGYLAKCEAQGTKPQGSRRADFMQPTGLLMLDFDHVGASPKASPQKGSQARLLGEDKSSFVATEAPFASAQGGVTLTTSAIDSPVKLWEYIKSFLTSHPSLGGDGGGRIALAHITPSGDGLRLVLRRTKGMSIQQEQYEFCRAMELDKMGIRLDDVCKDISRLSFAPMQKEILHFNPELLFAPLPEAGDYPDGTIFSGVKEYRSEGVQTNVSSADGLSSELLSEANTPELLNSFETEYNGVSYAEIVSRLEEQLGGRPEHGARNSFIFTMACNLRYMCNDDAQWIAQILPTYGEDPQKHRMTIQSAVNRPMSREMPETLKRALRVAALLSEPSESSENSDKRKNAPPSLPATLPPLMDLLTSRSPEKMRAAVAMSVFPPLGAHLQGVKVTYWDGRDYEPTFMQVLAAEMSAGKSAVNLPIEYIKADIKARDEVALGRMREWKAKCNTLKTTEDKPERPKGHAIQLLPADMTNAAFVQYLDDADGKFLYTQMDEIELLDSLKTNTRGGAVSAILRLAFDCGEYGQARVAANAVDARVNVRWNWNASTTIQRVRKYFAGGIADGTLSRLSFATIIKDPDDWGEERPKFAQYGQPFADALAPYIDRLTTCRGTLHCPEAIAWAEQMCDEQVAYARELDDRTYAQYSYRAVLMGFFRAMVLYIAHGMQWTDEIAEFAAWTIRYDMWCKLRFFSDMMHKAMEGERTAVQRGPASLLAQLPEEFTREQVKELRMAQGMKPNPSGMLRQWTFRGFVREDASRGVYVKL